MIDKNDTKMNRLTKKEQTGSIAQQFLREDDQKKFSKRKYENLNVRLRRMGEKKKKLMKNKSRNGFKTKEKGPKKSKKWGLVMKLRIIKINFVKLVLHLVVSEYSLVLRHNPGKLVFVVASLS